MSEAPKPPNAAATVPTVIVIGGPNGAGKSTIAPLVLRGTLGVTEFVNADVIAPRTGREWDVCPRPCDLAGR